MQITGIYEKVTSSENRDIQQILEFQADLHRTERLISSWTEFLRYLPEIRATDELINVIAEVVTIASECLTDQVINNMGAGFQEIFM